MSELQHNIFITISTRVKYSYNIKSNRSEVVEIHLWWRQPLLYLARAKPRQSYLCVDFGRWNWSLLHHVTFIKTVCAQTKTLDCSLIWILIKRLLSNGSCRFFLSQGQDHIKARQVDVIFHSDRSFAAKQVSSVVWKSETWVGTDCVHNICCWGSCKKCLQVGWCMSRQEAKNLLVDVSIEGRKPLKPGCLNWHQIQTPEWRDIDNYRRSR